jgi:hypothetical protein
VSVVLLTAHVAASALAGPSAASPAIAIHSTAARRIGSRIVGCERHLKAAGQMMDQV